MNVHFVIGRAKDPEDKEITDLIDQYILSPNDQENVSVLSAKFGDISDVGVDGPNGSSVLQRCIEMGNDCDDEKGLNLEEQVGFLT